MNTRFPLIICSLLFLASCKSATEPGVVYNYFPLSVGSQWHYNASSAGAFTRTCVGDTTVNGKTYTVIVQTPTYQFPQRNKDSVWYYRKEGNKIYTLLPDTMNTLHECTYIDPTLGASDSYYTLTFIGASERLTTKVTYNVTRQNFHDTTYGKVYPNAMIEHIRSEIFHPGSTSVVTEGDYYFAEGVGLEDQVVYGDLTMELTGYEIK